MYDVDRFRPLSGNLLSLHYKLVDMYDYKKFSSPIGESTFSTRYLMGKSLKLKNSFRPLSGNLLSLLINRLRIGCLNIVFVPYRGIYFLYRLRLN